MIVDIHFCGEWMNLRMSAAAVRFIPQYKMIDLSLKEVMGGWMGGGAK